MQHAAGLTPVLSEQTTLVFKPILYPTETILQRDLL